MTIENSSPDAARLNFMRMVSELNNYQKKSEPQRTSHNLSNSSKNNIHLIKQPTANSI